MKFWHSLKIGVSRLKGCKVTGHQTLLLHTLWPLLRKSVQLPSAQIWVRPGSNNSQSLIACNFVALWPTDTKFSAIKDLNPFQTVSKFQEASKILKLDFALSKWPHLLHKIGFVHSQMVATVPPIQVPSLKQRLFRGCDLAKVCGCIYKIFKRNLRLCKRVVCV